MCRLYGFRANEETKVECTLVHAQNSLLLQSESDYLGRKHADGWGIAFYHNATPERERRAGAAFQDLHFSVTAERVYTRAVVAHVRLATVGKPDARNSHPFMFGKWVFAHNGTVTAFDNLGAQLLSEISPELLSTRLGQTDSEVLFLWMLSRLQQEGIDLDGDPTADEIGRINATSISQLAHRCLHADADAEPKLNTILTNGRILVATRWNNDLYVVYREGVHDCEICGIPHIDHDNNKEYRAVVLASEPISSEPWRMVPNQSLVTISEDLKLINEMIPGTRPSMLH